MQTIKPLNTYKKALIGCALFVPRINKEQYAVYLYTYMTGKGLQSLLGQREKQEALKKFLGSTEI